MTGSGGLLPGCGVQMFILRQSSEPVSNPAGLIWAQTGVLTDASRTAGAHGGAATGAFHRSSPIGATAKGTERNSQERPLSMPRTYPCVVPTRHGSAWPSTNDDHGRIDA